MFPATKKNVLRSTRTCVLMCRRLSAETPSSTTSAMWCTRRSVPPSTPVPRLTAHTSPAPWSSNTSATSNMSPFVTKARVELLFIGFYMTRLQLSFVELSEIMCVMCLYVRSGGGVSGGQLAPVQRGGGQEVRDGVPAQLRAGLPGGPAAVSAGGAGVSV